MVHRRATTIPLASPLLARSSDRPGGSDGPSVPPGPDGVGLPGRLPIWSCSVRGLACHRPYGRRGALLPHLFTLTCRRVQRTRPTYVGRAFSGPATSAVS